MIDSQRGVLRRVGYNHLIFHKREWNNCFIKDNQKKLLDLGDFALQELQEDYLMVTPSWVRYNGSYIMSAKPNKSLELHYTCSDPVFNSLYYLRHIVERIQQVVLKSRE